MQRSSTRGRLPRHVAAATAAVALGMPACSSGSSGAPGTGPPSSPGAPDAASAKDGGGDGGDGGAAERLAAAPPVDPRSLGANQLLVTVSGGPFARDGFPFPAASPGGRVFADGWEIQFTHVLATIDKLSLWTDPDLVPSDPSQVGTLVAELDGPWAVDLHADGPGWPYFDGKEPGERAVALAVFANENLNGGSPFPTDGTRLAVGFSVVVATPSAESVNLDASARASYAEMIRDGCVFSLTGDATWKGNLGVCTEPLPPGGDAGGRAASGGEAEFARIPQRVAFDLCFKPRSGHLNPGDVETSYANCIDGTAADAGLGASAPPRGIAFSSKAYVVGQVTLLADAPFWESTVPGAHARFDPFAAQLVGVTTDAGLPTVRLDDVKGVEYVAFGDRLGNPLPWRTCDPSYPSSALASRTGEMHFDPSPVPRCKGGDSATGLCDYYDFSKYDQSGQGRWSGSGGLCVVQRAYPSPP